MHRTLRPTAVVAALTTLLGATPAAHAAPDGKKVIDRVDAELLVSMFEDLGGDATATQDGAGDPTIEGLLEGVRVGVYFYGCRGKPACPLIQLRAFWDEPAALALLNEHNRGTLLGRAYLDKDGDPTLEWTSRLEGGVTIDHLRSEVAWFQKAIRDFQARLHDARDKGTP
jgi:hypothetical protein